MYQIVYSLRIASLLCEKGFKVEKVVPNPKKPWLNSYVFEKTPELMKVLLEERGKSHDN